jgi:hypothetical protein
MEKYVISKLKNIYYLTKKNPSVNVEIDPRLYSW